MEDDVLQYIQNKLAKEREENLEITPSAPLATQTDELWTTSRVGSGNPFETFLREQEQGSF